METNSIWMMLTACAAILSSVIAVIAILTNNLKKKGVDDQRLNYLEKELTGLPCDEHTKILEESTQQLKFIEKTLDKLPCEEHTKILEDNNQRLKHIEQRISELPCKEHTQKFEKVQEKISELKDGITEFKLEIAEFKGEVRADIESLKTSVIFLQKNLEVQGKASPYKLNELGWKIYHDMKGDKFFEKNADMLIKQMEEINPTTAYDVEHLSYDVLLKIKNTAAFATIKAILYGYPELEIVFKGLKRDVTIDDVCYIFRLPLRDKYLELHPELLPENYFLTHKEEAI